MRRKFVYCLVKFIGKKLFEVNFQTNQDMNQCAKIHFCASFITPPLRSTYICFTRNPFKISVAL